MLHTAAFLAQHLTAREAAQPALPSSSNQSPTLADKTSQSAGTTQSSPTDQSAPSTRGDVGGRELERPSLLSVDGKTIVLSGAFLPERFKDTDADFNVGVVVGALQSGGLPPGVYVSLGGRVWPWDRVTRSESGQYVTLQK